MSNKKEEPEEVPEREVLEEEDIFEPLFDSSGEYEEEYMGEDKRREKRRKQDESDHDLIIRLDSALAYLCREVRNQGKRIIDLEKKFSDKTDAINNKLDSQDSEYAKALREGYIGCSKRIEDCGREFGKKANTSLVLWLVAIMLGIIGWNALTHYNNRGNLSIIENRLEHLTEEVQQFHPPVPDYQNLTDPRGRTNEQTENDS